MNTINILKVVRPIVTTLVLGEIFGGAISRPIHAWRSSKPQRVPIDKITEALQELHKRLVKLEGAEKEESSNG